MTFTRENGQDKKLATVSPSPDAILRIHGNAMQIQPFGMKRLLTKGARLLGLTPALRSFLPRRQGRLESTREAFEQIYRDDFWALRAGEYGADKPGMETEHSRNKRFSIMIQDLIRLNDVKSVVEFGCGWWSYAADVDWTGVQYDGFDVVEDVIRANRQGHAQDNIRFHIAREGVPLPQADMLISKDVLQHLPIEDIQHYMSVFRDNFRFMLIGNDCFPDDGLNSSIVRGGYRALRLDRDPFNYPNVIVQQWKCLEFGTFIVKNFCLFQGQPATGIETTQVHDVI